MARPKDETRRAAILDAATALVAERGTSATTAAIAARAGVSEGSLFTYFPDKDALLDALYRDLRAQMAKAIVRDLPHRGGVRERLEIAWRGYVGWGVDFPAARRALSHLGLSPSVRAEARAEAEARLLELAQIEVDARAQRRMKELPPGVAGRVMAALGQLTMDLVAEAPCEREARIATGFTLFWDALARS